MAEPDQAIADGDAAVGAKMLERAQHPIEVAAAIDGLAVKSEDAADAGHLRALSHSQTSADLLPRDPA